MCFMLGNNYKMCQKYIFFFISKNVLFSHRTLFIQIFFYMTMQKF